MMVQHVSPPPAADFARARPPADQPEDDPVWARKLLRYTLSLGVTTAISPGPLDLFTMLASFAIGKTEEDLPPLTEQEEAEMLERYAEVTPVFHEGNHGPWNMSSNWTPPSQR